MPTAFPPGFFDRADESDDGRFYAVDRLLTHIDDGAIAAVTNLYDELELTGDVLDLCSSWISHFSSPPRRLVALGMNPTELAANDAATEWLVHDLNTDPVLPFADASFDAVTCCVSVDYLTRPLEVFAEVARVLRPGGVFVCTFSNRCFPTKAIRGWLSTNDEGHCAIVSAYFELTPGFDEPTVQLRNPGVRGDPLFAVWARSRDLGVLSLAFRDARHRDPIARGNSAGMVDRGQQFGGLIGADPEHLARTEAQLDSFTACVVEHPAAGDLSDSPSVPPAVADVARSVHVSELESPPWPPPAEHRGHRHIVDGNRQAGRDQTDGDQQHAKRCEPPAAPVAIGRCPEGNRDHPGGGQRVHARCVLDVSIRHRANCATPLVHTGLRNRRPPGGTSITRSTPCWY